MIRLHHRSGWVASARSEAAVLSWMEKGRMAVDLDFVIVAP
jgi:hypothetical protein